LVLSGDTAKTFEDRHLDTILSCINSLLIDSDRFKQRAGAEVLVGLLRGTNSDDQAGDFQVTQPRYLAPYISTLALGM